MSWSDKLEPPEIKVDCEEELKSLKTILEKFLDYPEDKNIRNEIKEKIELIQEQTSYYNLEIDEMVEYSIGELRDAIQNFDILSKQCQFGIDFLERQVAA